MVPSVGQEEPQYICVVPVESLTGNQDEEIMTIGVSVNEAKSKAEQLLVESYGCNGDATHKLIEQARIEPLSQWCSPSHNQGALLRCSNALLVEVIEDGNQGCP